MVRLGESRAPAQPATGDQVERRDRIRRVASRLVAERGLEQVQMQEIAQGAGVALGTLYRYYPSKHLLLAGVMEGQIAAIGRLVPERPTLDPVAEVSELLVRAARGLMARPLLARAMITSVNIVRSAGGPQNDTSFRDLVLRSAGVLDPTDDDQDLARLVEQCAYGVLTWAVAGEITLEEAEASLRRAARLLLTADWA
jgi:TetR/AcrR family transcriptional regulator, cholesterol catabolism regulator